MKCIPLGSLCFIVCSIFVPEEGGQSIWLKSHKEIKKKFAFRSNGNFRVCIQETAFIDQQCTAQLHCKRLGWRWWQPLKLWPRFITAVWLMTVIRSRLGWQEEANLTQNDAISLWLLLFRPRCSPWLLVTQHLSQSHNFPQIWSAASQSPRASTALQYFRTSTPEHFGTGIYLVASLLNHSCSPNCTVVFQGRQLSIVATKDVPSGTGSH